MDSRLKTLGAKQVRAANYGAQNFYEIQSIALQDLPKVAARFSAPDCRSYAARLKVLDARVPTYAVLLQQEKATQIASLNRRAKNPKTWHALISHLGRNPQEQAALDKMSVAQIATNIQKVYDAAIAASGKPYSSQRVAVPVDAYTRALATPLDIGRFLWTKFKTERLLAIVSLEQKANLLDHKSPAVSLPTDPFGTGPLKQKGTQIYSVGPDAKDDGGKPVTRPRFVQETDKGDIPAPTF